METTHAGPEAAERPVARPVARQGTFWRNLSGALTGTGERRLFGRRGLNMDQVQVGRVFRHAGGKGRQETATIVGLCEILGMTHVRSDLRLAHTGPRPSRDGPPRPAKQRV